MNTLVKRHRPDGALWDTMPVRVVVLSGAADAEGSDGARPVGQDGTISLRAARGILRRDDVVQLPSGEAFRIVATRGLAPFYHLGESEGERVTRTQFPGRPLDGSIVTSQGFALTSQGVTITAGGR